MFFFFVDCVNRRFQSKSIVEINGILHIAPNLGTLVLLGMILFSGLPGTLKFISELYVFAAFFETTPVSALIVVYTANFIGLIGFSKVWYNAVFGMTVLKSVNSPKDLSYKELYILALCVIPLLFLGVWLPY
jgi:NADH:ubiquinone oxidoreductase subunit 4 (subunit M)